MELIGTVRKGVMVLNGRPTLAEGTKVRIEPDQETVPDDLAGHLVALSEGLLRIAGTARGLPPDLADNQDHYFHGQSKR